MFIRVHTTVLQSNKCVINVGKNIFKNVKNALKSKQKNVCKRDLKNVTLFLLTFDVGPID